MLLISIYPSTMPQNRNNYKIHTLQGNRKKQKKNKSSNKSCANRTWKVTKVQPEPTFHNTARKHGRFTVRVNWVNYKKAMQCRQRTKYNYLGVIIDSQLSLSSYVAALCRSGFYHLKQLRPLCRSTVTTSTSYKDTSTGVYLMSPGLLQLFSVRSDRQTHAASTVGATPS